MHHSFFPTIVTLLALLLYFRQVAASLPGNLPSTQSAPQHYEHPHSSSPPSSWLSIPCLFCSPVGHSESPESSNHVNEGSEENESVCPAELICYTQGMHVVQVVGTLLVGWVFGRVWHKSPREVLASGLGFRKRVEDVRQITTLRLYPASQGV